MGSELTQGLALTDKQLAFVNACAEGKTAIDAARVAGYAVPGQAAYLLRANPGVQTAVQAAVRRFLQLEAAPAAVRLLYDFMMDPKLDPKLRRACANDIKNAAGFIPPKAKDSNALDGKSLVDMSAEEMREAAARIQKELSDRAVVIIDNAPHGAQPEPQPNDILD